MTRGRGREDEDEVESEGEGAEGAALRQDAQRPSAWHRAGRDEGAKRAVYPGLDGREGGDGSEDALEQRILGDETLSGRCCADATGETARKRRPAAFWRCPYRPYRWSALVTRPIRAWHRLGVLGRPYGGIRDPPRASVSARRTLGSRQLRQPRRLGLAGGNRILVPRVLALEVVASGMPTQPVVPLPTANRYSRYPRT
ncbi:hypothetical protein VTN02DRAFT_1928 [Thermoascus thermophilus]